ncbi:branched-chain amino acid ABC transporter permease [Papillibacter cinnamivorans]|uniref:Branched-chain amino acid transport system permease protein n=1 Tax=Papillibacter cinnamivorans DSM 12816 TaxID=1122930 RepID=A0A1W2A510_9FIRM|nr:branched-chain amino acid ABC transporter permease [Papillibacter cinnamivorans]SMC55368.1 branched-chain amino acid transport system permease protein [Papillibacter cinnamivorans DSM 12816]
MTFLYQVINGLQVGSIYALVALGYSMVYGIVNLINFAHGDIIMVGAYCAWLAMMKWGAPPWISILFAIAFCTVLGMTIEKVAYKPLRKSPRISLLITAIGVSLFLENLAQLVFTANPQRFPTIVTLPSIQLGSRQLSATTIMTIVVSVFFMVVLSFLVNKTKMGKAMRAASEDEATAQLMGINVNHTISFTFAIGSALAAVGAILYCSAYTQLSPLMGVMLGLKAFVAAVLGGIGSIPGAMIGGLVIGLAESLTKGYISSQLADGVVFGILIVVLLIKPTGLMGRSMNEKV